MLNHIPPNLAGERAELKLYRGGHMFYVDPQSRKAFTQDASDVLCSAVSGISDRQRML